MAINPARYGLITNEYRWREAANATTATRYSNARELEIESSLDMANTVTLILQMFGVLDASRRRFAVDIVGTDFIDLNSFATQIPCVYFNCPELNASMLITAITRAVINEDDNITSLELWG